MPLLHRGTREGCVLLVRAWVLSLARTRFPELALALGAGYAAARLADEVARLSTHVLAQNFGNDLTEEDGTIFGLLNLFSTGPYKLNFMIGDTLVVYGEALSAAFALALLVLTGVVVVRRQAGRFGSCPFCAARVPHDAIRCAICGSALEPAES